MFRPFGTPTPNVFGNQEQLQNRPQTIGFGNAPAGNTGSVFGAPQSNVFGSNTNQQQLGQSSNLFSTQSVPLVQNPRYTTTNDLEGSSTITLHSISAMPAYVTKSFEEIRLDDYLAGRKGASMSTFGNAAFSGQTPGANISTGFGDSSKPAFGQQQLASSGSFSSVAPTGSVFGGNVSTNAFGVPQSQQTFGSQQAPSLFGTRQTSSSGVFGAQSTPFSSSQAPQATSFGASIGATGATNSVFGSQQQSAFGDKPSIFGTQPSSNSLFGVQQGNNMPGNQQQATPFGVAPASTFGGSQGTFGASSTPAAAPLAPFGASSNSNLFGAQNQQQTSIGSQMFPFGSQTQQTPFGTQSGNSNQTQLFGSAQKTNFGVQSSGLFGSQQPSTFGGQQPTSLSAQHQQPSSFGTQQPGQSLSLFGTQSQQQPPLQNQQLQTSAQTNLGQQPMATKPSLFGGQSISFPSATSTVGQSSGTGKFNPSKKHIY